jgi:hypothetical protein
VERAQFSGELVGELGQLLLAPLDESELALDVLRRRTDDAEPVGIARTFFPLVAQGGALLLRLGEADELLEGEAKELAEPDQLSQSRDIGARVESVCAFVA